MNRRTLLKLLAATPLLVDVAAAHASPEADDRLLDEIERRSFRYFWEQADPITGQVKDRARAEGTDTYTASSIAATGFALSGLCIAYQRGYAPHADIRKRVHDTLAFVAEKLQHVHGFYFHFVDMRTGARMWNCELSTIDSALLLAGVLTCRQHFRDVPEIVRHATTIYERVEWPWFLDGHRTLSMGWKPDSGFLDARWEDYCELMMLYLMGIGSPTHPLPPATWHAWKRSKITFEGLTYVSSAPSLFIHQYSHAWFDFRHKRDAYANWFTNSVIATKAHKRFCLSLSKRFPDYTDDLWGFSASDSAGGYTAWGGPPDDGKADGTVVPCAAGGSIPFLPADCLRVLHTIRDRYGRETWGRYSFVDAFNPLNKWVNPDVIGIDLGITMLMAENQRSGFVWDTFMKDAHMRDAMRLAGFRQEPA